MNYSLDSLKTFFNDNLAKWLEDNHCPVKESTEGVNKIISGYKLPVVQLAEVTGIHQFLQFNKALIQSFSFQINTHENRLQLTLDFDHIHSSEGYIVKDIHMEPLVIDYNDAIHIGDVNATVSLTIQGQEYTQIAIQFSEQVLTLNVNQIDIEQCLQGLIHSITDLPELIRDFFLSRPINNTILTVSLNYHIHTHCFELQCTAQEAIGYEFFKIHSVGMKKDNHDVLDATIRYSSYINNKPIIQDQVINITLGRDTCSVHVTFDLPQVNLGDLIEDINIFVNQVDVIERKNWQLSVDFIHKNISICSPQFQEWLNLNFCDMIVFSSSNLVFQATDTQHMTLTIDGGLIISGQDIIAGNVQIARNQNTIIGTFTAIPYDQHMTIPICIGLNKICHANVQIQDMTFSLEHVGSEHKKLTYTTGDCSMNLSDMPVPFEWINHQTLVGKITGDAKHIHLELQKISSIETPVDIPIHIPEFPVLNLSTQGGMNIIKLNVEDVICEVESVSINLAKEQKVLTGILNIYLPEGINKLFGMINDKPILNLFKAYSGVFDELTQEDKEHAKITFHIQYHNECIALSLETSPFANWKFHEDEDDQIKLDLKQAGQYTFSKPLIGYNDSCKYMQAQGDIRIDCLPEAIPTGIIKTLIKQYNLERLNTFIPDYIPLFLPIDDKGNILERLTSLTDNSQLKEFFTYMEPFETMIREMLHGYIHYDLPASMGYTLTYAGGKFQLKLEIIPDESGEIKPLKAIIPTLVPSIFGPQPGLAMINLRSLTWGAVWGVPLMELDADVEFMDLGSLIIGDVLNKRNQHALNKLVIRELLIINPFTYPIPLFFDDLHLTYHGLEQLQFDSQFQFKKPAATLFEIASFIQSIYENYLTKNGRISKDMLPEGWDLTFTILQQRLELPPYLGGVAFGYDGMTIQATDLITHIMNGCKYFNLSDFIKVIPIEHRQLSCPNLSIEGMHALALTGGIQAVEELEQTLREQIASYVQLTNAALMVLSGKVGDVQLAGIQTTMALVYSLIDGSGVIVDISGTIFSDLGFSCVGIILCKIEGSYLIAKAKVNLLGLTQEITLPLDNDSISVNFDLESPIFTSNLSMSCEKWQNIHMCADVELKLDLDVSGLSPGPGIEIPHFTAHGVNVLTGITIKESCTDQEATIDVSCKIIWGGKVIFQLDNMNLKIKASNLLDNIESTIKEWVLNHIQDIFAYLLKDPLEFMKNVIGKVIDYGVEYAEKLGEALGAMCDYDANKIADLMKDIPDIRPDDIATALWKGAGIPDVDGINALDYIGVGSEDIVNTLKNVKGITDPKQLKGLLDKTNYAGKIAEKIWDDVFHCSCIVKIPPPCSCILDIPSPCGCVVKFW